MHTELGRISRISTRRAYVVIERSNGSEAVEMTDDASFYDPPPSPGDLLIRLDDGTLSHKPARSVTENGDMPICGPARLNDTLDRLAQTLNERCRDG